MRTATPRQCCLSTRALRPEWQKAFDQAALASLAGFAKKLGVSTSTVEKLMHAGKAAPETVERVEQAFVAAFQGAA